MRWLIISLLQPGNDVITISPQDGVLRKKWIVILNRRTWFPINVSR